MTYTLITEQGQRREFYILELAKIYQIIWGGHIYQSQNTQTQHDTTAPASSELYDN